MVTITQRERFEQAKAALKAFDTKHGNTCLFSATKAARTLAAKREKLQDAVSDAYWTPEMETCQ
jgi:hydroxymethylpyrimidine/phosphomethylpyrimidine kinase